MSLTGYYDQSYPPSLWAPGPDPGSASDDDVFTEPTITAQDALNAAKLGPLGYVADPLTAWPTGDGIYVNVSYRFYWNGTAWQPGLAPVVGDEPTTERFEAIPVTNTPEETEPNPDIEPDTEPVQPPEETPPGSNPS
jgi:hypothetical protein